MAKSSLQTITDYFHDPLQEGVLVFSMTAGAVVGLVIGLFHGFMSAGIGGAIVGGVIGLVIGGILGLAAAFGVGLLIASVPYILTLAVIVFVIWVIYALWGVGKP